MSDAASMTRFRALVAEFAQAMQLPDDHDAEAISIEAGDMQAVVRPHPRDPGRVVVVVAVQSLGSDEAVAAVPAARLLLIHRLNAEAWREHAWQIQIDGDNVLGLRSSRDLASVTLEALEAWIVDGLERAQTLADLWRDAEGGVSSLSVDQQAWRTSMTGMIRG